jgi:erythromycin esterase-like protein
MTSLRLVVKIFSILIALFYANQTIAKDCDVLALPQPMLEKKIIILGELHGTKEAPEFASNLVCNLVRVKGKVALAIEMPASFQRHLDAALNQKTAEMAEQKFAQIPFWQSQFQDGKRSVAYMELLMSIWRMRENQPDTRIVAIDMDEVEGNSGALREQFMATRLRSFLTERPNYTLVALVGNLHGRRQRGTPWNAEFKPMATFLEANQYLSLDMAYDAGSAWNCTKTGCGARPVSKKAPTGVRKAPTIELSSNDPNFDGEFQVWEVTASPPLKQNAKEKSVD